MSLTFQISKTFFGILGFHYYKNIFYIDDLIFPTLPIFVIAMTWYAWRRYQEVKKSDISLELFRKLVDQSNDLIFVVDPETGQILDVNEEVCRNLKYGKKKLLQMKIPDIEETISSEKLWKKHVQEVRKNNNYLFFEGTKRRKDGSIFPVEISVRLIKEGSQEYIIAVARDITKRKQSMDKLLESYKHVGIINRKIEVLSSLIQYKIKEEKKTIQYLLSTAMNFSRRDCSMFYKNGGNNTFRLIQSKDISKETEKEMLILSVENWSSIKTLIEEKRKVFATKNSDKNWPSKNLFSILALPLISHGNIIGIIVLGSATKTKASNYPLEFYDVFSVQASRMYAHLLDKFKKGANTFLSSRYFSLSLSV
ncbi:PAS domain S-box protein [Candidatus Gracilibacteria bacterium]|nr:PAS domain S-box protein [Candidatus Gracilibacteria bacterium]